MHLTISSVCCGRCCVQVHSDDEEDSVTHSIADPPATGVACIITRVSARLQAAAPRHWQLLHRAGAGAVPGGQLAGPHRRRRGGVPAGDHWPVCPARGADRRRGGLSGSAVNESSRRFIALCLEKAPTRTFSSLKVPSLLARINNIATHHFIEGKGPGLLWAL